MSLPFSALVLYGVIVAYLLVRGVPPRRIAMIVLTALGGGLALAFTLGFVYYLVVLQKPAETISFFAMLMLPVAAASLAREHILQTITPTGIILLNVAANLAPAHGLLPLSLAWLAGWIPVADGPVRVALNFVVLYFPSLLALLLLWRGPPGNAMVRYVLAIWVIYVGIAALVGPGWHLLSGLDIRNAAHWLASAFAAYAAVHVLMLTLSAFMSISDKTGEATRSVANTVRVDRARPSVAAAVGLAFWAAVFLFVRMPARDHDLQAAAIIAAAFAAGMALASREPRDEAEPDEAPEAPAFLLGLGARVLVICVVFGGFALLLWRSSSPDAEGAARMTVSPATGMQAANRVSATSAIEEGPDLPGYRNLQFRDPMREKAFTDWLTAKGVHWERVRKRDEDYIVWDNVPRAAMLPRAFDDSRQFTPWLGVDYYALYIVAEIDPGKEAIKHIAAFETDQQRERFVAWLGNRGVRPETSSRGQYTFVTWESADPELLRQFTWDMQNKCVEEYRRRGQESLAENCR